MGSAVVERLGTEACEVPTVGRADVDPTRQAEVEEWLAETRPEVVIVATARVGYDGGFRFDTSRPDGQPRKLLYSIRMTALGWHAKTPLEHAAEAT